MYLSRCCASVDQEQHVAVVTSSSEPSSTLSVDRLIRTTERTQQGAVGSGEQQDNGGLPQGTGQQPEVAKAEL